MIVIDKLCYQSKLRYENAGEKFAFAVLTLLICVVSRSIAVAGIVFVRIGATLLFTYLRFHEITLHSACPLLSV